MSRLHEVGIGYRVFLSFLSFVQQLIELKDIEDPMLDENEELLSEFMSKELRQDTLLVEFMVTCCRICYRVIFV